MPRTTTPDPRDFREQIVALVRAGRSDEELAGEFERCAAITHNWVKQAERDAGRRADILSSVERGERARGVAPTAARGPRNQGAPVSITWSGIHQGRCRVRDLPGHCLGL